MKIPVSVPHMLWYTSKHWQYNIYQYYSIYSKLETFQPSLLLGRWRIRHHFFEVTVADFDQEVLIILTFDGHPTLGWHISWVFTPVEAFVWLWRLRDIQLPSGVILDEMSIAIEENIRDQIFCPPFAAKSDGMTLSHRMDRAQQDDICICGTVRKSHLSHINLHSAVILFEWFTHEHRECTYFAQWCWLHCWIDLIQTRTSTLLYC